MTAKDRKHADRLSVLIALRATGEAGAAAVANLCEWPRAKAEAVLEELVELGLVVAIRRPEGMLWRLGGWAEKPEPVPPKRTLPAPERPHSDQVKRVTGGRVPGCPVCGAPRTPKWPRWQRWCSDECRRASRSQEVANG
jgi:hypothetical protein